MSNFGSINWMDVLKGAILSALTVVATWLVNLLQSWVTTMSGGTFPTLPTPHDLTSIGTLALLAFVGYLAKQFLTNSQNVPLKKEPPTA